LVLINNLADIWSGWLLSLQAHLRHTFPYNFHFENDHIIVAADGNLVAVYFRDKRQLSVFRFSPDNLDD
jgi:hypothetical protein